MRVRAQVRDLILSLPSSRTMLLSCFSHVLRGIELELRLAPGAAEKKLLTPILYLDVRLVPVESLSTHRIVMQHRSLPMSGHHPRAPSEPDRDHDLRASSLNGAENLLKLPSPAICRIPLLFLMQLSGSSHACSRRVTHIKRVTTERLTRSRQRTRHRGGSTWCGCERTCSGSWSESLSSGFIPLFMNGEAISLSLRRTPRGMARGDTGSSEQRSLRVSILHMSLREAPKWIGCVRTGSG